MTSRLQRVASSRAARTAFGYAAGAWVLIQVIATVSEPLGWPAYGLRLVIIGVTAGFVVAVPVAAWYDRRERVAAALVAAPDEAPGSASEPILTATPPMPDGPSVAVLAFADMSAARDQDYFCEGTAEEIINALNRVQGLRVAARAGSFQFKHRVVDTRDIGRLLNVRAVLDGSVRKSGDRVRIAAQLIDAQDGAHLWSETFDRQIEDIFAIQDEIARRTVQALRVTLLTADKSRLRVGDAPGNVAAYDHYLRARQLSRKEKDTEQSSAADQYRQALQLDPDFAAAHAALASLIAHMVQRREELRQALAPEAQRAIDRASTLAPDSADTQVAVGQVHAMCKRYDEAATAFRRAIELDPRFFDAHYYYARFCVLRGDHAQAAAHYEQAFALQPDDFLPVTLAIQEYQALHDRAGEQSAVQRAWTAIERRLAIDPGDAAAHDHGIGVLALLGRREESLEFAQRAIALRPHDASTYYNAACGAVHSHDYEQALDWLERAVELGYRNADWIANDPDMNPLRSNPRYHQLLKRLT